MDDPSPSPPGWRKRLLQVWPSLDREVSIARRSRADAEEQLAARKIDSPACKWIDKLSDWACPRRGLGDFARFVLFRYRFIQQISGKRFCVPQGLQDVRKIPTKTWVASIRRQNRKIGASVADLMRRFDTQLSYNTPPVEKDLQILRKLVGQDAFWAALAAAANLSMKQRGQKGFLKLKAEELRCRRFAGSTAVEDFIAYLNCGFVPAWQAAHADDLCDLGAESPKTGRFEHDVPFFESPERSARLDLLVAHCVQPPDKSFRVSCLYSPTEPHGLVAACNQFIGRYASACVQARITRLPVIYVPVGLQTQGPRVSRREVIRDLYRKLCVDRSGSGAGDAKLSELAEYATGEQVDSAVGAIRRALADCPTLLIFGVHHVSTNEQWRAVEEEILDSPLPYALDRMMPEVGQMGALIPPDRAYGTHAVILADGALGKFSTFDPYAVELPCCPQSAFPGLLEWCGCPHVAEVFLARNRRNVASNEVELAVAEVGLSLAQSDSSGDDLRHRISQSLWDSSPGATEDRTPALLEIVVAHLIARARTDQSCAWDATILQIIALSAGGLRQETAARVLAGYMVATASCDESSRPAWQKEHESALWNAPHDGPLTADDVESLAAEIARRLDEFQQSAAGAHIRVLTSIHVPALDAYAHPYESPEVPTFNFQFPERRAFELRFPQIQSQLCQLFKCKSHQKHALIRKLLAEQSLRRAAIVQRHGTDRDQLSLVEKRYAIAAIYHALDSLGYERNSLLSDAGKKRSKWLLEPSKPLQAYHWIYRWLYVAQVNAEDNILSRQHGAELLRAALLDRFVQAQQGSVVGRRSLRPFLVRSEILCNLAHAGLLSCSFGVTDEAVRKIDSLCEEMRVAVERQQLLEHSQRRAGWLRRVDAVRREAVRLRLEQRILCGGKSAPWAGWRLKRLIATALQCEEGTSTEASYAASTTLKIWHALQSAAAAAPPFESLNVVASDMRVALSRSTAQHLYDYLMRYAEIVVNSAERHSSLATRMSRLKRAVCVFEFAEALRRGTVHDDESEQALGISARPTRTAARACLTLGREWHKKAAENIANAYFARAAYLSFHFIGNLARYQVERVAALILEASTIRIRSQLCGRKGDLELAMEVLRTAERALIHYPCRLQLWLHFYLERAKLFRDRALELGPQAEESAMCRRYNDADLSSVERLAGGRKVWSERARRVRRPLTRA